MDPGSEEQDADFFHYLERNNLHYPVDVVENFLLSLKSKQFVILSGGSGTGKTKLAQSYGRFISEAPDGYRVAKMDVTLNKLDKNGGVTYDSDEFFDKLPFDGKRAEGTYMVRLGDVEAECTIKLMTRLWFKPNLDRFIPEIVRLRDVEGRSKTPVTIRIPCHASSRDNYVIVPVGSNWNESRFITGFRNILDGGYSSTPSLELIIRSNEHPAEPHLLILDEMNLSHVERYFSEILSAMESGEKIRLDSDGDVPGHITIDRNLFIVGTVNVDETTYAFSPKVLDRANVIEFEPVPVSDYAGISDRRYEPAGDRRYLQDCMSDPDLHDLDARGIVEMLKSVESNKEIVDTMIGDLNAFQRLTSSISQSFGFRTIDEIMRFMLASWRYTGGGDFVQWKRFFDAQIKQKILPKIHGNLSIRDDLTEMRNLCIERGYSTSEKKLSKMIGVLEKQRYVSFNI